MAIEKRFLSVFEYLVNQKADINAKTLDEETPLHYAAKNGCLSVVEYLINQKVDINAKNKDVEYLYFMRLLFIWLQRIGILKLLNISLIRKLI